MIPPVRDPLNLHSVIERPVPCLAASVFFFFPFCTRPSRSRPQREAAALHSIWKKQIPFHGRDRHVPGALTPPEAFGSPPWSRPGRISDERRCRGQCHADCRRKSPTSWKWPPSCSQLPHDDGPRPETSARRIPPKEHRLLASVASAVAGMFPGDDPNRQPPAFILPWSNSPAALPDRQGVV